MTFRTTQETPPRSMRGRPRAAQSCPICGTVGCLLPLCGAALAVLILAAHRPQGFEDFGYIGFLALPLLALPFTLILSIVAIVRRERFYPFPVVLLAWYVFPLAGGALTNSLAGFFGGCAVALGSVLAAMRRTRHRSCGMPSPETESKIPAPRVLATAREMPPGVTASDRSTLGSGKHARLAPSNDRRSFALRILLIPHVRGTVSLMGAFLAMALAGSNRGTLDRALGGFGLLCGVLAMPAGVAALAVFPWRQSGNKPWRLLTAHAVALLLLLFLSGFWGVLHLA